MRKQGKTQILDLIKTMSGANDEIKKYLERNQINIAAEILSQNQDAAIKIGNTIEASEGEGFITVSYLEEYCEVLFHAHEEITTSAHFNPNNIYKKLNKAIIKIENSVKNDIPVRKVAVFLPYKVSMWDSLESVWMAADADPNCDAYVIPIPYFDKAPDGTLKAMHYEGDQYPANVPITRFDSFDFEKVRPDMIFIHNPYDNWNTVTTVPDFFYSENLKKFTDCLVYIPYYATSGGMSEAQSLCPAYINADYIVIQSEKYRKFFDPRIPDEKFLPFGSPKFDSVIRKCQNPPEPPAEWKKKMFTADGTKKKVFFYNTSIGGMLTDTDIFLKKMEYVFQVFAEHPEVCLLWRPHPLLESTFDSMRQQYKPRYEAIKQRYIDENIGIFDTTPTIEEAIALSDVYVGDSGTSVTSLFGVAGKPQFILNNYINTKPQEDDWKGEITMGAFDPTGDDRWIIAQGNKLWHSEKNDYHYSYYCDLNEFSGQYYMRAKQIGDKVYVAPSVAQDILIIQNKTIKKVSLNREIEQGCAFVAAWYTEKYMFLIPYYYPKLVRYEYATGEILYMDGIRDFLVRPIRGEKLVGGSYITEKELILASPTTSEVMRIDIESMKVRINKIASYEDTGSNIVLEHQGKIWMLPMEGYAVRCWNPENDEVKTYDAIPEDFYCLHWPMNIKCERNAFSNVTFIKDRIILSPAWGNMYLELDEATGKMKKWNPPADISQKLRNENGYYITGGMGGFLLTKVEETQHIIWDAAYRNAYYYNQETDETQKLDIVFDKNEILAHEAGFKDNAEWLLYCCMENAVQSLEDFITCNIKGNQHDKNEQLKSYEVINKSSDGKCGDKVYSYVSQA